MYFFVQFFDWLFVAVVVVFSFCMYVVNIVFLAIPTTDLQCVWVSNVVVCLSKGSHTVYLFVFCTLSS